MASALCTNQAAVPPPSYHRATATALHLDALTLVTRLHLLEVCRVAGPPGGAPQDLDFGLPSDALVQRYAMRWDVRYDGWGTAGVHRTWELGNSLHHRVK
jgi:hypothetical protein